MPLLRVMQVLLLDWVGASKFCFVGNVNVLKTGFVKIKTEIDIKMNSRKQRFWGRLSFGKNS